MTAPKSEPDKSISARPPDNERTRPGVGAGSSGGQRDAYTGDTTATHRQERPPHIDAAVDVLVGLLNDAERISVMARTVADEFGDLTVDDRRSLGDRHPHLVSALLAVEHHVATRRREVAA